MSTPTQTDPRGDDGATFAPPPEFVADAVAGEDLHRAAAADREAFWAEQSRFLLDWRTPFTQTLDWSGAPFAKWFADGTHR
ncbi:acetyl-coenzyme A synthetase N-terminal domain-containing protein, partial [Curtobacterium flaccumfaciens]|uniref:acetyl-coenzyme A synthetase N-terminal domain-containing protein n=1 Tax=Curtobacterium flaccumfaciens TaxID=2035 RepID=UPI00266BED4D